MTRKATYGNITWQADGIIYRSLGEVQAATGLSIAAVWNRCNKRAPGWRRIDSEVKAVTFRRANVTSPGPDKASG